MVTSTNRDPVRRLPEKSSLMGVVEFRPRLAVIVVFLTIMILVVGWRIFRESGAPRMNALAEEAVAVFAAPPPAGAPASPLDPGEAQKRILAISGVTVELPRDAVGIVIESADHETIRRRPAAAMRFRHEGGRHLLIVFRQDHLLGARRTAFPDESLLSGERNGRSFVLWEREGATFIMVSDADVARAFELVRRLFS